jgi:hypothetical protein
MIFNVGDQVIYEDTGIDGRCLRGEVVDIWKINSEITNYFTILDSGVFVQFTPHNPRWKKIEEQVLIPS